MRFSVVLIGLITTLLISGCSGIPGKHSDRLKKPVVTADSSSAASLTHSVIQYLNGENIIGLKETIDHSAFDGFMPLEYRKREHEVYEQMKPENFMFSMIQRLSEEPEADKWYFHKCRKGDVYSHCTILNENWELAPFELTIDRLPQNQIIDITNYNNSISAKFLARASYRFLILANKRARISKDYYGSAIRSFFSALESKNHDQIRLAYGYLPRDLQQDWFPRSVLLQMALEGEDKDFLKDQLMNFVFEGDHSRNMLLVMLYYSLDNDYQAAEQALDDLDKKIGQSDFSLFIRGALSYESGEYKKSLSQSVELMRLRPDRDTGHWLSAFALVGMGHYQEAADMLQLAEDEFGYNITYEGLEEVFAELYSRGSMENAALFMTSEPLKKVLL